MRVLLSHSSVCTSLDCVMHREFYTSHLTVTVSPSALTLVPMSGNKLLPCSSPYLNVNHSLLLQVPYVKVWLYILSCSHALQLLYILDVIKPSYTANNTIEVAPLNCSSSTDCPNPCSDGFYCSSGVCLPRCDQWQQYSPAPVAATDAVAIINASLGLIAGIMGLVISCIRWKRM